MKSLKLAILIIPVLVSLNSCKSQYDMLLSGSDVDAKYKAAFDYFNKEKYQKAASLFESMAVMTNGTERDDTVQYYWGLSNYKFKDYYTAESNFSKFVEKYPSSPFTSDARFLRLDCLFRQTLRYELDPSPTYTAISALNEYVIDYPSSEHLSDCYAMLKELGDRLDKKAFEGAKLYYRMEDYKASRVAFRNILKDDADNIYREDILYYTAMSSYHFARLSVRAKQKERYMTFMDDYFNFIGECPESPYRKELNAMYARAQKSIGRYVGEEELMEGQDKSFAKERKEAEKQASEAMKKARKSKKDNKTEDVPEQDTAE